MPCISVQHPVCTTPTWLLHIESQPTKLGALGAGHRHCHALQDIYTLFHLNRDFKFISKTSNFLIPIIGWSMFLTGRGMAGAAGQVGFAPASCHSQLLGTASWHAVSISHWVAQGRAGQGRGDCYQAGRKLGAIEAWLMHLACRAAAH